MPLQRGRIFGLLQFKRRVTAQEVRPGVQRQWGAGAEKRFLVLFRTIEQNQGKKIIIDHFKTVILHFTSFPPYLVYYTKTV